MFCALDFPPSLRGQNKMKMAGSGATKVLLCSGNNADALKRAHECAGIAQLVCLAYIHICVYTCICYVHWM
jgi:hypothetical protein